VIGLGARDETDHFSRDHEDHLEDALAEMRQQMEDLKSDLEMERSRLQRDNGRLQDLVSELNLKRTAEVDSFRSELARLEEEADDEVKQLKEDMRVIRDERERLTIVRHFAY
jgi:vacuolar-type H+-ATPase subunit I/STV1